MSKHWQPEAKVVRLRPRRRTEWTRASAYGRAIAPRGGGFILIVLGGAAVVGVAGGAMLATTAEAPVSIETLPREGVQGSFSAGSTSAAGARLSFGYCHSGGGTNCVVDGDTFYIGGAKVRIASIDTPETHPPRCEYEAALGQEATEKLHALLNSGAVTMTSIDRNRDSYGRLLRNVQVDGADVGEAMVGAGVARDYATGRRGWC